MPHDQQDYERASIRDVLIIGAWLLFLIVCVIIVILWMQGFI